MKSMFLAFVLISGSLAYAAAQTSQNSLVGCFNRQPDGILQFGARPSGDLFTLRGNTNLAEQHVDQLVRVSGDVEQPVHNANGSATLAISNVEVLAGSCSAAAPATNADGIPGKVGEDSVAVPLTDTLTEGQTTPGSQIESAGQSAASHTSERLAAERAAAPPHPEQFGQSQAGADVNAISVERTEILPDNTLGVAGNSPNEAATAAK